MEVKAKQRIRLWNGDGGLVLSVVGTTASIRFDNGVRKHVDFGEITSAIDTITPKEAKFRAAQHKLAVRKVKAAIVTQADFEKMAPGQVDEGKWDDAKGKVKKQRDKNIAAFTDQDWGLVSTIYKNMGGTFSKAANVKVGSYILYPGEAPDKYVEFTKEEKPAEATEEELSLMDSFLNFPQNNKHWIRSRSRPEKAIDGTPHVRELKEEGGVSEVIDHYYLPKGTIAGHPKESEHRYEIGDGLVPADAPESTDILRILDVVEKNYVVEKRPFDTEEKQDPKNPIYGVRFEISIKQLDGDKKWVKFCGKEKTAVESLDVKEIKATNRSIHVSFGNFKAIYLSDGKFVRAADSDNKDVSQEKFSVAHRKEFGNLIKTCGVKKLQEMVKTKQASVKTAAVYRVEVSDDGDIEVTKIDKTQPWDDALTFEDTERLKMELRDYGADDEEIERYIQEADEEYASRTASKKTSGLKTKIASIKKKADKLGQWDFDTHEPVWKLEAGEEGNNQIVRIDAKV